jgi:hypothetical protein
MELNLFGHKINLLNAIIFLIVGFLIATLTVCSCARVKSVKDVVDIIKGKKGKHDKKDEH